MAQIATQLISLAIHYCPKLSDIIQEIKKKSLLNIVGPTLRSLFGTHSQEDSAIYLQKFQSMEEAGYERQVQIDEQTTLVKSIMQIITHMNCTTKRNNNSKW